MLTRAEIEINAKTVRNYLETLGTGNFSSAGGRLGGFGWVTIKFKGFPSKALKYSAIGPKHIYISKRAASAGKIQSNIK